MNITINGKVIFTTVQNVQELIAEQGLEGKPVIVEHNGSALTPSSHVSQLLKEGDKVEFFVLGAGG